MQPDAAPVPPGMLRVACDNCRRTSTVTPLLLQRLTPKMACGYCRKITTWQESC